MSYTAKIEQTIKYKHRMRYMPADGSFAEKEYLSLAFEKGVPFPSGWI